MKKIIYFLIIIILLAGIAGGAYAGYKHFKKDKDTPATENILTESKALLNNHASITFGEGDSAWTISTADKLEPIYIDDSRAPGNGINSQKIPHGNSSNVELSDIGITVAGDNLIGLMVNLQFDKRANYANSMQIKYDVQNKKFVPDFNNFDFVYQNIAYSAFKNHESAGASYDICMAEFESKIATECTAGDNYLMGIYQFMFIFGDMEKYPDYDLFNQFETTGSFVYLCVNIPVYYRVK